MVDEINDSLTKLCDKLSSGSLFGQGAYNYTVDAKLFYGATNQDSSEKELIEKLVPNSVVGGIEKSDLEDLLNQVFEGFNFCGDEGSHPNLKYLHSEEFKQDLDALIVQLKLLFGGNAKVSVFWLKEGHPFYPVYWEYDFLIKKTDGYFVLISSSSD